MSENKWVRPVSFNKNNPKDQERLKLVGRKAFSTFVKKLIDEEIKRKQSVNKGKGAEGTTKLDPFFVETEPVQPTSKIEELKKRRDSQKSKVAPRLFINQPRN
ncbi:hypothetical protein [Bacillus sp. FJAT-45350]|uniref:hypothetical protein n=1 Tax=Bacillus sp. FJAT-45350 TaxID=2011014 RepID=UPI000BB977C3|nr:hypothetical protein [Bacillus sp. FJAT-45350]